MPTRFYLPSGGTAEITPVPHSSWDVTIDHIVLPMPTVKSNTGELAKIVSSGSSLDRDTLAAIFVSEPLSTQTIAAQIVKLVICAAENDASDSQFLALLIRVMTPAGAERGVVLALTRDDIELAVESGLDNSGAWTSRVLTATTSSVDAQSGDLLVAEIGVGGNDTSGSPSCGLVFQDDEGLDLPELDGNAFDRNPWLEFADVLSFGVDANEGTSAVTLPALAASASGSTAPSVSGSSAVSLSALTMAAVGSQTAAGEQFGSVTVALPKLTADASSTLIQPGMIEATLPALTAFAIGETPVRGDITNIKVEKELIAHVYDSTGAYITTWNDWSTLPAFKWPINEGPGVLEFELPRAWFDSGEPGEGGETDTTGEINLGYTIKLYVVDAESGPEGVLIYQGRLSEYEFDLSGAVLGGSLYPRTSRAVDRFIADELVFDEEDPTQIAKYLIDNNLLVGITWDATNPNAGIETSPTFSRQRPRQVLNTAQQLAGGSWYWRINPDYSLTFNKSDLETPDHMFIVGRHIGEKTRFIKSDVERRRRVYLYGAEIKNDEDVVIDQIQAIATSPDYDPELEPLDHVVANNRITDSATATRIASALLEFLDTFFIETEVVVLDSNFDPGKGYDIESLKPGQTARLYHPDHAGRFHLIGDHIIGDGHVIGGTWLDQVLRTIVIAEVDYHFTHAILKLKTRPNRLAEELVTLSDRLLLEETRST